MSTQNKFQHVLNFGKVTGDVSIRVTAFEILKAPSLAITDNILTITDNNTNGKTDYYDIFVYDESGSSFISGVRIDTEGTEVGT